MLIAYPRPLPATGHVVAFPFCLASLIPGGDWLQGSVPIRGIVPLSMIFSIHFIAPSLPNFRALPFCMTVDARFLGPERDPRYMLTRLLAVLWLAGRTARHSARCSSDQQSRQPRQRAQPREDPLTAWGNVCMEWGAYRDRTFSCSVLPVQDTNFNLLHGCVGGREVYPFRMWLS